MKKNKLLAVLSATALGLSGILAACGGTEPAKSSEPKGDDPVASSVVEEEDNKFAEYTKAQWLAEDFSNKEVSYQFVSKDGAWELAAYGLAYDFMFNAYADGSIKVEQRNVKNGSGYSYYGFWYLEEGEDGKQLDLSVAYMSDLEGGLNAHVYDYEVIQQNDNNWSFVFDFALTPGQYYRQQSLVCDNTVKYANEEAFHTAVDVIEETMKIVSVAPANNFDCEISLMSNGTATCALLTEYNGAKVAAVNATGTWYQDYDSTTGESKGYKIELEHSSFKGGKSSIEFTDPANITWVAELSMMGQEVTLNFTLSDASKIVVEPEYPALAGNSFVCAEELNGLSASITVDGTTVTGVVEMKSASYKLYNKTGTVTVADGKTTYTFDDSTASWSTGDTHFEWKMTVNAGGQTAELSFVMINAAA